MADKSGVDFSGVKFGTNPFCEIALEESLRMKERGWVEKVTAVSLGGEGS